MIYGNYPSLGSSINWLLLGDESSCCLVGVASSSVSMQVNSEDNVYVAAMKSDFFSNFFCLIINLI